jgi:hypothetical protein
MRTPVALILLGAMAGVVSCSPDTEHKVEAKINPHFDTNYQQPVVPSSSYESIRKRGIGPIFSVEEVTDMTTTIVYDDAATKPCIFEVPTKNIELKESGDGYSYLRLHYKDGVDQSKLVSCADLTSSVSRMEILAEPEVAKQFAR